MCVIAHCIRHSLQNKTNRQIGVIQDKWLTKVKGAVYFSGLEWQNEIEWTF
jgi:hypothetical protein